MPMQTDDIADKYFTRDQAAEWIGQRTRGKAFTKRTLIKWEEAGIGPPVTRIGRTVAYYRPSVETWLRKQEARE